MSDLFEKSMRTLELPAVLEMLAQRAVSDEAKERCRRLRPSTEPDAVSRLLDETDAAKVRLGLHGSPSFTGVKDVAQPLNRADHGGMLNTRAAGYCRRADSHTAGQRLRCGAAGGTHGHRPAVLRPAAQ